MSLIYLVGMVLMAIYSIIWGIKAKIFKQASKAFIAGWCIGVAVFNMLLWPLTVLAIVVFYLYIDFGRAEQLGLMQEENGSE